MAGYNENKENKEIEKKGGFCQSVALCNVPCHGQALAPSWRRLFRGCNLSLWCTEYLCFPSVFLRSLLSLGSLPSVFRFYQVFLSLYSANNLFVKFRTKNTVANKRILSKKKPFSDNENTVLRIHVAMPPARSCTWTPLLCNKSTLYQSYPYTCKSHWINSTSIIAWDRRSNATATVPALIDQLAPTIPFREPSWGTALLHANPPSIDPISSAFL
jgi:hypothetical protein